MIKLIEEQKKIYKEISDDLSALAIAKTSTDKMAYDIVLSPFINH